MARSSYLLPAYGSPGHEVHGFLLEAVSEGEAWLKAQRATLDWDRVREALGPADPALDLEGESNTGYNKTNRIFRDLVASLTNFKYEGEYRSDHDATLYERAHLLTKRDRDWFRRTSAQARIREGLQNAVGFGTGYFYQDWDKAYWGPGRGDVRLTALDPSDVTCIQLPKDHDLQRAYMVLIRFELPINLARSIYRYNPGFAAALEPDRESPGWLIKGLKKVQQLTGLGSPVLRLSASDRAPAGSFPTVDVYHAYTVDGSVNMGEPVELGAPGANWSYRVPTLGGPVPTGVLGTDGQPITRTATEDDALLFPLRRLTIFSRSVAFPAYDGSSPWWHGKTPVARVKFNDKAWEPLGQSLLGDVRTMQSGVEGMMRDMEDSSHARMDPPLGYDDQKVSKDFAESINPRRGGVRAAMTMDAGEIFKVIGQPWQYEVPAWVPEFMKAQEARMDYLAGTPDLVAIAKARQVPSSDSMEKILEMAGPLVQDMVRAIEEPFHQLGEMRKALYLQYDSRARLIHLFGDLGNFEEQVAYAPDLIVPIVPGESADDRRARTKTYIHEFQYHLTQTGMNEIHRMVTKLSYLQLAKVMPISWWTLAKVWQVPNFGPVPKNEKTGEECKNEIEMWLAQQLMQHEMAEEFGGAGPGGAGPGRPNSNKKAPSVASKGGGTRTTVKTS